MAWWSVRIQTVEDLYTQSYVLPFLVPMLENAGATVLLPRERDPQTVEIIVDNDRCRDGHSVYSELNGSKMWKNGEEAGFAHLKRTYKDFENPFREGISRGRSTVAPAFSSIGTRNGST